MCIAMSEPQQIVSVSKRSASYSIKKVLKTFFKKQQKQKILPETLESLENHRNSQAEIYDMEVKDNSANEKLALIEAEQQVRHELKEEDIYVPVRFARTEVGTFFWTTNLQPVMNIIRVVDEDLVQPAYCYSSCQYPQLQFGDRWAQA